MKLPINRIDELLKWLHKAEDLYYILNEDGGELIHEDFESNDFCIDCAHKIVDGTAWSYHQGYMLVHDDFQVCAKCGCELNIEFCGGDDGEIWHWNNADVDMTFEKLSDSDKFRISNIFALYINCDTEQKGIEDMIYKWNLANKTK